MPTRIHLDDTIQGTPRSIVVEQDLETVEKAWRAMGKEPIEFTEYRGPNFDKRIVVHGSRIVYLTPEKATVF